MSTANWSTGDVFLVWTRRTSSTMSMIASIAIIYMIAVDWKIKLKQPSNRLFLVMTIFDIIQSTAGIFASAPIPSKSQTYGAIGNDYTCTAQGFFFQLGLAVPLYNASLSLYYLVSIRYKMNSKIFAKRIEPICHVVSILFPLSTAIIGLYLGSFGERGFVCWITISHSVTNLPFLLTYVEIIICFIFILVSMTMTYLSVLNRVTVMQKYSFVTEAGRRPSVANNGLVEANETLKQAFFYVAAFSITFVWPVAALFVSELTGTPNYTLRLLLCIFYPLQGFWNLIAYSRRGCIILKRQNPDKSYLWVIIMFIRVPASVRRMSLVRRCSIGSNGKDERVCNQADEETNDMVWDSNGIDDNISDCAEVSNLDGSKIKYTEVGDRNIDYNIGIRIQENNLSLDDGAAECHISLAHQPSLSSPSISLETTTNVSLSTCGLVNESENLTSEDTDSEESKSSFGLR